MWQKIWINKKKGFFKEELSLQYLFFLITLIFWALLMEKDTYYGVLGIHYILKCDKGQ